MQRISISFRVVREHHVTNNFIITLDYKLWIMYSKDYKNRDLYREKISQQEEFMV